MVAGKAARQAVFDQPGAAMFALETIAAMPAQGQRGIAATVEEQQALLAAL